MTVATTKPDRGNLALSAVSFFLNVSSSVVIIFVNKQLMRPQGAGFNYATTLCGLHYIVCALYMWVTQLLGIVKSVDVPLTDLLLFAGAANISIVSLNLSLMMNAVGFYQIAKLLVIPFVCFVEYAWFGRRFTAPVVAAVSCVVLGVAVVTITADVSIRTLGGTLVAALSVVGSGMQQILCRAVQQRNNVSSQELLAKIAPLQGFSLMILGPPLDYYLRNPREWVFNYQWTHTASVWLFLSCSIAILVNVSQFMVLGRFTAVTYQVLGHSKTILVLLGSWLVFHEQITMKQVFGMALAVLGMVWYGAETGKPKAKSEDVGKDANETVPLIKSSPIKSPDSKV